MSRQRQKSWRTESPVSSYIRLNELVIAILRSRDESLVCISSSIELSHKFQYDLHTMCTNYWEFIRIHTYTYARSLFERLALITASLTWDRAGFSRFIETILSIEHDKSVAFDIRDGSSCRSCLVCRNVRGQTVPGEFSRVCLQIVRGCLYMI